MIELEQCLASALSVRILGIRDYWGQSHRVMVALPPSIFHRLSDTIEVDGMTIRLIPCQLLEIVESQFGSNFDIYLIPDTEENAANVDEAVKRWMNFFEGWRGDE